MKFTRRLVERRRGIVTGQWEIRTSQHSEYTKITCKLTPFPGMEAVEGRDALDLGHQLGARQDGAVGVDAVHRLAEGQLLMVIGGMEETACGEKLQAVFLDMSNVLAPLPQCSNKNKQTNARAHTHPLE